MQRLLFGLLLLLLPACDDFSCDPELGPIIFVHVTPASGRTLSPRTLVLGGAKTFEVLVERSDIPPRSSWTTSSEFFCGTAIHIDGEESCLSGIRFEDLVEDEDLSLEFFIEGESQRSASYVVGPQRLEPPSAPTVALAATTPFWRQPPSTEELRAPVDVEVRSPPETVVQIVFESGDEDIIGSGNLVAPDASLVPIRVEVEPWDASSNAAEPCFYAIASDLYGNTSPKSERFCPAQEGANLSEPTFAPTPDPRPEPE